MDNRLLMALMQAAQHQPQAHPAGRGRLAQAMARGKQKPGDAKYTRLGALPPYGEPKTGGDRDHANGSGQSSNTSAFQGDAFQNDAYQV